MRRIGDGILNEPQGLALLPDGRVAVADTVNHTVRAYDPETGAFETLAGTGRQWWQGSPTSGPALDVALSSPWDVAWWGGKLWIAMAGVHQLWTYDPETGTVEAAAGTTNEGLVDGPAAEAWFAQPSGLAATEERLWIADSETSALRWIDPDLVVHTAVGTGLFDFGHRDGPADQALLQHPLGVTALPDGSVAVSDTYNHALRRYDPVSGEVSTLATDLREPSGAVLVGDDIVVVESARHRLTRLRLPDEAVRVEAVAHRTQRAATEVAGGTLQLDVVFQAPAGQKLDTRYGPSTRLLVSSTPPELLVAGEGAGTDLVAGAGDRSGGGRGRAAHLGDGGVLRRRSGERVPGLPCASAGLGRPGEGDGGRGGPAAAGPGGDGRGPPYPSGTGGAPTPRGHKPSCDARTGRSPYALRAWGPRA